MSKRILFQAEVSVDEEARGQACFERTRPLLQAIPENKLLPVTIEAASLAAATIGRAQGIREFRDQAALLPGFDVTCMDVMEDRAYALMYANRVYLTTIHPDGNLPALNLEAVQTRERFRAELLAFCASGLLDSNLLDDYTGRPGYRPVSADLSLLVAVYEQNWDKIAGRTMRTLQELDRAEGVANAMVRLFGLRNGTDARVVEWMNLRQRAFTLLVRTYEEARWAVLFLRRHAGDADSIAPSLFLGRTKRKRAKEQHEGSSVPAPSPQSPSDISSPQ